MLKSAKLKPQIKHPLKAKICKTVAKKLQLVTHLKQTVKL